MRYKLLIVILFFIFGCSTEEKFEIELKRGSAVVEGQILNYENHSKVIRFAGKTIIGDITQTAIIDSIGNFRVEIELINPQNVNFEYEERWGHLYLRSNDSLFVKIDASLLKNDDSPYYEVSGLNSTISNNIRDFFQFYSKDSFEPKYGDSVSIKEYLKGLEKQLSIKDSVLNEFSKQHNPNKEFINWAKKNNIYSVAGNLLLYFWYFDVNHNEYKTEIFDKKLFPLDDDSAIVSDAYFNHLNNYLMANYYKGDTVLAKLFNEKNAVGAYTRIFNSIKENEKKGLGRDILFYNLLSSIIKNDMEDSAFLFSSFIEYIENQELVGVLLEKKAAIQEQGIEQSTTLNLQLNTKSKTISEFWKTISEKHKNKIIYIDIWATWCGPCRGEIPYAIDLHNYFEGKQIAFVNLCLASNKDDWGKMIKENHIKGDHYFFNVDETALLRDELKFHGYPTYMIIDKNGILIDRNAPRPSSTIEIKEKLNELLKK